MAIDSHFYDTLPGKGINEVEWAQSAQSRGPVYGVTYPYELLLTPHPSTPYAVNISPAPKGFWGHGVWDTSDAVETIICTPPAKGTRRFDLIAGRRDWTPTGGGPTALIAVQGSATRVIPAARQTRPGETDDQPLWLVEWLGGETQPQSVTDLRCFSGPGGIMANDRLALTYLKAPGARVQIGQTTWTYQLIRNREWDWVAPLTEYTPITPPNGYAVDGRVSVERVSGGRNFVLLDFTIARVRTSFELGTSFTGFGPVIPPEARGASPEKILPVAFSGAGAQNILGMAFINPLNGHLGVRGTQSSTWLAGAEIAINCAYYI